MTTEPKDTRRKVGRPPLDTGDDFRLLIRLHSDYGIKLCERAYKVGVKPGTLARMILHEVLNSDDNETERTNGQG